MQECLTNMVLGNQVEALDIPMYSPLDDDEPILEDKLETEYFWVNCDFPEVLAIAQTTSDAIDPK